MDTFGICEHQIRILDTRDKGIQLSEPAKREWQIRFG